MLIKKIFLSSFYLGDFYPLLDKISSGLRISKQARLSAQSLLGTTQSPHWRNITLLNEERRNFRISLSEEVLRLYSFWLYFFFIRKYFRRWRLNIIRITSKEMCILKISENTQTTSFTMKIFMVLRIFHSFLRLLP